MIWSLVSEEEMYGFGTNQVFRFYQEAIGKNNIKLAVVSENDELDFVDENDVVLLRTANNHLIDTITRKGIKSTAESIWSYELVSDKARLASYLKKFGVLVPNQYSPNEFVDGKKYFVKPRHGSDSKCISYHSICESMADIERQTNIVANEMKQAVVIEDFIEGVDCTVACVKPDNLLTYAIDVECEGEGGIQTRSCKVGFKECCSALYDNEVNRIASFVFHQLNLKHHARIDFRRGVDGKYYLIDVNLLPGLGPIDHFAKCLLLSSNISYTDAIKLVVKSATR